MKADGMAIKIREFFNPAFNGFWQWSEDGNVVELVYGHSTICYRDDLLNILKSLNPNSIPRLGSILLLLAAGTNRISIGQIEKALISTLDVLSNSTEDKTYKSHLIYIKEAMRLLTKVNQLEETLRTGPARVHLINELTETNKAFSKNDAKRLIFEFGSGTFEDLILNKTTIKYSIYRLKWDIISLAVLSKKLDTQEKLELKLKTGLDKIPDPIDLEMDEEETDLLTQLMRDERTEGLVQVIKQLIPVLKIPMHMESRGDMPIGGVSDITNKGSFDKLLLSELAYEDALFTARLVNKEALYYQREIPPIQNEQQRLVFIDKTIRMWGTPKLLGMAIAAAFHQAQKKMMQNTFLALGRNTAQTINLISADAFVESLETVEEGLDCIDALSSNLQSDFKKADETVFISHESNWTDPEFVFRFNKIADQINFVVSIEQNKVLLFQCSATGRKLIRESVLDLKDFKIKVKDLKTDRLNIPLSKSYFYSGLLHFQERDEPQIPFRLPSGQRSGEMSLYHKQLGDIVCSKSGTYLLFFDDVNKGGLEIFNPFRKVKYAFGEYKDRVFILCYQNNEIIKFLSFQYHDISIAEMPLEQLKFKRYGIQSVHFFDKAFFIKNQDGIYKLNIFNGKITKESQVKMFPPKQVNLDASFSLSGKLAFKNIRSINILENFIIQLNNKNLKILGNSNQLEWISENNLRRSVNGTLQKVSKKQKKYFEQFDFKDGSMAIIDKRGILHLVSSDKSLAQVSIVMLNNGQTAAWSSNNKFCGNSYFYNYGSKIEVQLFFNRYVKPILKIILEH